MPKVICALPCENVILSQDNKMSLISLMESLMVGVPKGAVVPANATLPMRWFAVCIFERQEGEETREFETYVEIGTVRSATAKFTFKGRMHRVIHQIAGVPVQFGELPMKVFLLKGGKSELVFTYPLSIQRLPEVPPSKVN